VRFLSLGPILLLAGCAGISRHSPTTTAPEAPSSEFRAVCDRYVEGFGRFYSLEARVSHAPLKDGIAARELLAYLRDRPRRSESDRIARNRALHALRTAKANDPKTPSTVSAFFALTRECDYVNVPYGWTTLINDRKRFVFTKSERRKFRKDFLAYLRDDDSVAADFTSAALRIRLATLAADEKFLDLDGSAKRRLAKLRAEADSDPLVSRAATTTDPEERAKGMIAEANRSGQLLGRLRRLLPAK
jgi:hypothetical protein